MYKAADRENRYFIYLEFITNFYKGTLLTIGSKSNLKTGIKVKVFRWIKQIY